MWVTLNPAMEENLNTDSNTQNKTNKSSLTWPWPLGQQLKIYINVNPCHSKQCGAAVQWSRRLPLSSLKPRTIISGLVELWQCVLHNVLWQCVQYNLLFPCVKYNELCATNCSLKTAESSKTGGPGQSDSRKSHSR